MGERVSERLPVVLVGDLDANEWGRVLGDGFAVSSAASAAGAVDRIAATGCAILVSGPDLAELHREVAARWPNVLRIVVAADAGTPAAVRATCDLGAFGFLPLPIEAEWTRRLFARAAEVYRERRERTATVASLRAEVARMRAYVGELEEQLVAARAGVDRDTDLWDREYLVERIEDEANRLSRYGVPFGAVLVRLEGASAELERAAADLLQQFARRVDVAGRFEPGTFVILCPNTDPEGVTRVPERLRAAFAEADLPGYPAGEAPPVRVGGLAWTAGPVDASEVLARLQHEVGRE